MTTQSTFPLQLKNIGISFLPFLFIILAIGLAGTNFFASYPIEIYSPHLFRRLPELVGPLEVFVRFTISIFTLILAHTFAPIRFKKPILILGSALFLVQRLETREAILLITSFFILFVILKTKHRARRIGLLLVSMVMLAAGLSLLRAPTYASWGLYAQILLGLVGIDNWLGGSKATKKSVRLDDAFIYLLGFHGAFATITYGYEALNNSYLKRPLHLIAQDSPRLLSGGFLKLFSIIYLQTLLFPYWNAASSSVSTIGTANPEMGTWELVLWSLIFLYSFLIELTGFIQIHQGISRLFGYDVKEHALSPWLSISFLDYWRRTGTNMRDYMLTHIMLPVYGKTRSLYLSVISVWSFWAFISLIMRGGFAQSEQLGLIPPAIPTISLLIKFSFLYAHVSYIEMRFFNTRNLKIFNSDNFKHGHIVKAALTYLIFYVTLTLGNEIHPNNLLIGTDIIKAFLISKGML